jgi:hypothetical protein
LEKKGGSVNRFAIALLAGPLGLLGCVEQHATLTNPETGQKITCSNEGVVWFGNPLNDCIDNAYSHGYGNFEGAKPPVVTPDLPAVALEIAPVEKWTVRFAKKQYKAERLTRKQYEHTVDALRAAYDEKVRQARQQYNAGTIPKSVYEQRVDDAAYDYKG